MKKEEARKTVESIVKDEFGKLLLIIDAYLENNRTIYDETINGNKIRKELCH